MSRFGGAAPAGWFVIAEGAVAAAAAVLFGLFGIQRMVGYTGTGDDYRDGVAALVIAITFLAAIALAVYGPLAILVGRAVRRGSHAAWIGALGLSGIQLALGAIAWPLVAPLSLLGLIALVLLMLPETRAQCAAPPVLEDV